jgi:hypothetical protein
MLGPSISILMMLLTAIINTIITIIMIIIRFDSIFNRAPGAVVREALQLLASKAMEKSSAALHIGKE